MNTARKVVRGSVFLTMLLSMSIMLTGCSPALLGILFAGVADILNGVANIVSAAKGTGQTYATDNSQKAIEGMGAGGGEAAGAGAPQNTDAVAIQPVDKETSAAVPAVTPEASTAPQLVPGKDILKDPIKVVFPTAFPRLQNLTQPAAPQPKG